MSRLVRRRPFVAALAALAGLAAPSAAHAASYTVKAGDGFCGGADLVCGGLVQAAAAAQPGDVFSVSPGVYPAATFAVENVTIVGAPAFFVEGTMVFSGNGANPSKLSKVALTSTTTEPALVVSGSAGVQLSDAAAFSHHGHAIFLSASEHNTIARTLVATGGAQTSAVRIESTTGTPRKALTIDSSIVFGGGAGIGAVTRSNELQAGAGDIAIEARHLTAAGSTNGILLDASAAAHGLLSDPVGNITMKLSDSIAFAAATRSFRSLTGGANVAAIDTTRTITNGDKNAIFADAARHNYRLRPGSIAIGQGSVTAGESPTDIDGEDRSAAPTDLGGDEYSNAAPVARIALATKSPRARRPVSFDAGGSTDREAGHGGGIVQYRWSFSDGATQTTSGPRATHAFPHEGAATASVVVVDRQGAVSAPAAVGLELLDGTPPAVAVVVPKANQRISRFVTRTVTRTVNGKKRKVKRRTRRKIAFAGLSSDASGVSRIVLTLEKLVASKSRSKSSSTRRASAKASATSSRKCYWLNPRRGVMRRSCDRPALLTAKLVKNDKNGAWTYTVPRNLAKGRYRLSAAGVDGSGLVGNVGGAKLGVVKFTLT